MRRHPALPTFGTVQKIDIAGPLIVVVEDDGSMASALKRLLSAAGFRVRLFDSAEALGASAWVRQADCLVLDMRLPGVGAAEFYASLSRPRPPALFITAHDGPVAQRSAERVGALACLAKPFDGTDFLRRVTQACHAGDGSA